MKLLYYIFFIGVVCSCSKKSDNTSTLSGSIKAYDKYGNENGKFDDISIKLIDKQNQESFATVASDGKFRFENVTQGEVLLTINKPGYGFIDTIQFNHEKTNDTLSNIDLIEDLPFTFKLNYIDYSSGWLSYPLSCDYHTTTDSYMATYFVCFSKYADASINHANLLWAAGTSINVQIISGYYGGKSTFALKNFTDAGFVKGDKIYVALIPSIQKFGTSYHNKNINYKIISYKVRNASNVAWFILNE